MRALTVRQPWAWAIVHGGKDVENRSRNVAGSYRGPIAIHAGLQAEDGEWPGVLLRAVMQADMLSGRPRDDVRGAVIGVVDLVGAHDERLGCCPPWGERSHDGSRVVHLELERPRALAVPVPCRGALGLWALPDGVRDVVLERLVVASAVEEPISAVREAIAGTPRSWPERTPLAHLAAPTTTADDTKESAHG